MPLNATEHDALRTTGLFVVQNTVLLTCTTLLYGAYLVLFMSSAVIILRNRSPSRTGSATSTSPLLICASLVMFVSTTLYCAVIITHVVLLELKSIVDYADRLFIYGLIGDLSKDPISVLIVLEDWPGNINFFCGDLILVWRTWNIWRNHKTVKAITGLFLAVTGCFCLGTSLFTSIHPHTNTPWENVPFVTISLVLSFLTNVVATSFIGIKAWRHRQHLKKTLRTRQKSQTTVSTILMLCFEWGFIYSGLQLLSAILNLIPKDPLGNLDLAARSINHGVVIIAAMYPTVLVILVALNKSIAESAISSMPSGYSNSRAPMRECRRDDSDGGSLRSEFKGGGSTLGHGHGHDV